MPIVVDKDAGRLKIVEAFQECLREKPFDRISLRDVAKRAGMPHTSLLSYFKNRQEIILAFVDYVAENTFREGRRWASCHHLADFDSPQDYIKGFFNNAAKIDSHSKLVYTGALNVYIMSQYDPEVARYVREEKEQWIDSLFHIISAELDIKKPRPILGHYIFACISAICLNTYNGWLDAETYEELTALLADIIVEESKK